MLMTLFWPLLLSFYDLIMILCWLFNKNTQVLLLFFIIALHYYLSRWNIVEQKLTENHKIPFHFNSSRFRSNVRRNFCLILILLFWICITFRNFNIWLTLADVIYEKTNTFEHLYIILNILVRCLDCYQ